MHERLGDGVLIYFVYPQAHEGDAERAVRAGLELVEAVVVLKAPVSLQTSVGVATGLVVVGERSGIRGCKCNRSSGPLSISAEFGLAYVNKISTCERQNYSSGLISLHGSKGGRMLDGKRYYAAFPDEDPDKRYPSALLNALEKLELEFRKHFPTILNQRPCENNENMKL